MIAECHGRKQDALARFEISDVFAGFNNVAGNITAIDVRQLHSGQAFPDEQIEMIQGAGFYSYEHLVFAKLRVRDIFKLQHLRPAKFMDAYSLHRLSPCKLARVT